MARAMQQPPELRRGRPALRRSQRAGSTSATSTRRSRSGRAEKLVARAQVPRQRDSFVEGHFNVPKGISACRARRRTRAERRWTWSSRGVSHRYGDARRARDDRSHGARGRDPRADRPLGLRQVDPARHPRRHPRSPARASVLLRGEPPAGSLNPFTYMFQDFALLPWRDVAGNVALPLEHHALSARASARARVDDALARTGLREFRARAAEAALRRHAPARRHRPRAGGRAGDAADGRAALGARRADARAADGGLPRAVARASARRGLRHPQPRRGAAPRRPHRRPVAPARAHPRDRRGRRAARRARGAGGRRDSRAARALWALHQATRRRWPSARCADVVPR